MGYALSFQEVIVRYIPFQKGLLLDSGKITFIYCLLVCILILPFIRNKYGNVGRKSLCLLIGKLSNLQESREG